MRCITSGRLTPAAATLTRISPGPGAGSGRCSGTSTSGPPGARIATAVMVAGRLIAHPCDRPAADTRPCPGWQPAGGVFTRSHFSGFNPAPTPLECVLRVRARSLAMAAIDEDDRPKKKLVHEIGQDLALLSVDELSDRIALLREEIARLDDARAKKQASRSAADGFFKK